MINYTKITNRNATTSIKLWTLVLVVACKSNACMHWHHDDGHMFPCVLIIDATPRQLSSYPWWCSHLFYSSAVDLITGGFSVILMCILWVVKFGVGPPQPTKFAYKRLTSLTSSFFLITQSPYSLPCFRQTFRLTN